MKYALGELHHGVSYEDYAAQEGLRASALKLMKRSPAHYKASLENPKLPTDAQEEGKLIHTLFENVERFREMYITEPTFVGLTKDGRPSTRSAEAKAQREDWWASLPEGSIVVTQEQVPMIEGIIRSVMQHSRVRNMIRNSTREASGWVKDPETGLTLQFRPDLISSEGHLSDFKSTVNAHEDFFLSTIFGKTYFYILQAAHYSYTAGLLGLKSGFFNIIAVEKEPPYGINLYPMNEGTLDAGERWRKKLTAQFADCLAKNEWPGYDEAPRTVFTPAYFEAPSFGDEL